MFPQIPLVEKVQAVKITFGAAPLQPCYCRNITDAFGVIRDVYYGEGERGADVGERFEIEVVEVDKEWFDNLEEWEPA